MQTYLCTQLLIFAWTWQSCEPGERPLNHCKTIATANARLRFELCRPPTHHATARHKPRDTPPNAARLHAAATPQGRKCQTPQGQNAHRPPRPPSTPPTRRQHTPPNAAQNAARPKPKTPCRKALTANYRPPKLAAVGKKKCGQGF